MNPMRLTHGLSALVCLAACTGASHDVLPSPAPTPWSFSSQEDALAAASCPDGAADGFAATTALTVTPVSAGSQDDLAAALDGIVFRAGWSLSTSYASFGGLSGLKVSGDGSLLAVSDSGALVELPFDQQALEPLPQATITFLTDETGAILTGKSDADAEGLEVRGGLVFVSFERRHRIAAYGYALCGSQARAVPVARMTSRPAGLRTGVAPNAGGEALALDGDRLLLGIESMEEAAGPIGEVRSNGTVSFEGTPRIDAGRMPLVGLDISGGTRYSLHRAYNPLTGRNHIRIYETKADGSARRLADLGKPLMLDNFEGIAVLPLADGRRRIFIISDDNFSEQQETLLYVFETVG